MADTDTKELELRATQVAELQRGFNALASDMKAKEVELKAAWKKVEQVMIDNDIKSIKGDWGSVTIVEKPVYRADDLSLVPSKFIKKALDTTKIAAAATLEGKVPKGITKSVSKYLQRRIK